MNLTRKIGWGLLVFSIFSLGVLRAENYQLDPRQSRLEFKASSRFSKPLGQFHRFDVKADIDSAHLENSQLTVTIDIDSIDTGIKKRDRHLRSPDFFDAERFPQATLMVKSIHKQDEKNTLATADLTLHGITKSITLPVQTEEMEGHWRLFGETVISRNDFSINYKSALNPIADEVRIFYSLLLIKTGP